MDPITVATIAVALIATKATEKVGEKIGERVMGQKCRCCLRVPEEIG